MRANGLVALMVALIATLVIACGVPGCNASPLAEGPRNAKALQADDPAASAMREPAPGRGLEEMTKSFIPMGAEQPATAPSPDNWSVITTSMSLFGHPPYVLDLMLGFLLSIMMALLLTAFPKSLVPRDPVAAMEERNGGVIVALVGCTAAELVQSSEQLTLGAEIALVLFGIGGLIRFRTVFGDPRRTGMMILITILGLSCGMSQYALAILGFVVVWWVRYFLLSNVTVVVQVRPKKNADIEQVRAAATAIVASHGLTIVSAAPKRSGKSLELRATARGSVNEEELQQALEDAVPGARVRVSAS